MKKSVWEKSDNVFCYSEFSFLFSANFVFYSLNLKPRNSKLHETNSGRNTENVFEMKSETEYELFCRSGGSSALGCSGAPQCVRGFSGPRGVLESVGGCLVGRGVSGRPGDAGGCQSAVSRPRHLDPLRVQKQSAKAPRLSNEKHTLRPLKTPARAPAVG